MLPLTPLLRPPEPPGPIRLWAAGRVDGDVASEIAGGDVVCQRVAADDGVVQPRRIGADVVDAAARCWPSCPTGWSWSASPCLRLKMLRRSISTPELELPDRVELVSVAVPDLAMPPLIVGRVGRQGGIGQRRRAGVGDAAAVEGRVADRVELVSVKAPELKIAPPVPSLAALPPVIVKFSSVAVTPELTSMMRKACVPAAVLRATATPTDGPVMVVAPVVSVSVSWPAVRAIVFGVLNTVLSKSIVSAPVVEFAWPTAQNRRVPTLPSSKRAVDGERREQRAVLQPLQQRPPPAPGLGWRRCAWHGATDEPPGNATVGAAWRGSPCPSGRLDSGHRGPVGCWGQQITMSIPAVWPARMEST